MKIPVPLWVLILGGLTILVLMVILWSAKRRRRPRLELEETDIDDLVPSIVGITQGTMTKGNRIELVQNGAFWDWLFRDLESAR
ncbi:MAG TPA: hypothetical protein VG106_05215, partial [Vicinamibacterales bacterium]|nr:hypothetical protein [Vicinamibacterales bacterium]